MIVQGNFNDKVRIKACYRNVAGMETIHNETNNNSEELHNLAIANNLLIITTKFKHKYVHQVTRRIPESDEGNQIDHVLMGC